MKKKFMLFLLALLPLVASSAPVQIKGIYYNLNTETGEAEVTNSMGGSDQAPKSYSGSVDIPSSVNFGGIEYSVTSIGDRAFSTCVDLTSVTIPNSVTSIGDYAFNYCTHLPSVIIPSGVTSIGELAFFECFDLESIYIPRSVTSIGQYAFSECGLSSVSISSTLTSIENGVFEYCKKLTSVTIPSSVTSIGKRAFLNCSGLTSVTIGCRVESIGSSAFRGCSNLTTITSMVINPLEIGDDVFQSKTYSSATLCVPIGTKGKYEATAAWNKFQNIEEMGVEIDGIYYLLNPETKEAEVTNRTGDSFGSGSYSGSVTIPPSVTYDGMTFSVTSIGKDAFLSCTDLTSVRIPNSVTSIGEGAFYECSGLTSLTIGNSVTNIGDFAFSDCIGLTSITIPSSVTSIGEAAFEECSGLTTVTIGSGVTSIGDAAFYGCGSLTSVTSFIVEPFEIDEYVFFTESDTFTSATLYVPKGTKAKYEATPAWNKFQKIEEIEVTEKMGDVNGDGAVDVADIATIIDVMAGKALQYKGKADVNGDHTVDVADIATVIDIMAGKDVSTGPDETIYTACPNDRHPHIIDLGLPSGTLWACCNVGAKAPEDYGNYYAWGETEPTEGNATLEKYAHSDGTLETCHDLGTDIAGTQYDAATANWKAPWRMPTLEEFEELKGKCTSEWTTLNGKNGRKFTGPSGGTIFLPTSGILFEMGLNDENVSGGYWSANPNGTSQADFFYFNSDYMDHYPNSRYIGHSIRPVR